MEIETYSRRENLLKLIEELLEPGKTMLGILEAFNEKLKR